MDSRLIACDLEVNDAMQANRAVVALESTLIAQGLPWPENLETARSAENAVRAEGATPATMALLDRKIKVGLNVEELETVARSDHFVKASRRDLGASLAAGRDAALTVSATLAISRLIGIAVMATGGLGGVHRGAGASFDVSTDLDELGRADGMLVVCSGAKALLDLPATLEALETRGVMVVGFATDTFPGFTVTSSGLPLDWSVDTPEAAARVWRTHRELGLPGAMVLVQSVPEEQALSFAEVERETEAALKRARDLGLSGKALTPFMLRETHNGLGRRGVEANQALIVANSRLAAQVAVAFKEQSA
jgi:pseudouridine-5'-phosphate glycosidase